MKDQAAQPLREQLTFEQQARYDALLERRTKKTGTARVLSLPLLGTFGLEHFYLGNPIRGVVSLLFCWTLIPTVSALFDLLTGDIKRQVAHANARNAKQVYAEVLRFTPPLAQTPVAPVIPPLPSEPVVAEVAPIAAAPAIAVAEVAITTPSDAPAVQVSDVQVTQQAEQVAEVSESFSSTVTTSHWQPGMDAPVTDSVTASTTASAISAAETTATSETVTAAVEAPASASPAAELNVPVAATDAVPALTTATIGEFIPVTETVDLMPVQIEAEAQPLVESDALAADGVLIFVEDQDILTTDSATSRAMPVQDAVLVDQVTSTATQAVNTETQQVATAQYHDGKLVAAEAVGISLSGEINTLLTDHTQATAVAASETAATPSAPWVDVSPLHGQGAHADAALNLPASNAGLGQTNVPGGDIGDGTNPTNVLGGGLSDPTSTDPQSLGHRPDFIAD